MLIHLAALLLTASAPAPRELATDPRVLHCTARNTAEGKDRRCDVKIPRGAAIRRCDATTAVGHCALHPRGELVAWAVASNGAQCRLSKKRTDWTKSVTIKVDKATKPGGGSCALYVELR